MNQEREPEHLPMKIPAADKIKQLETDIGILKTGYQECINDLADSNKALVMHLGMDPVELTGEVIGHQAVLDSVSSGRAVK
jgi:phosphotransferase system IIA component